MRTYLVVYICSALLALMITPVVIYIARAFKIYDKVGVRKIHASVIPRIGGIAIILAMLGTTIPVLWLDNVTGHAFRSVQPKLVALILGGMFVFMIGLIDDIAQLRASAKLIGQIIAAILICGFGIRIEEIVLFEGFVIEFGWFSWPLTLLWIVGITNAVNLTDGLDGLAAGISAITCAVIAVFALYINQPVMVILMLAMLGSLSGFLFFNFNPARIFMGDCGSMFLGFILASSSVMCTAKSSTLVALALPGLALGVPIFDTLFSMLRRFQERRSMFAPDRGHFHHRLLDMGLHHKHVVILIYLMTVVVAGLAMFMMITRDAGVIIILVSILVLLMLIFRLVGTVGFKDTMIHLQHNRSMAAQVKDRQRSFEDAKVLLRQATDFDQWWQAVQYAAEQLGFARLSLPQITREGVECVLHWRQTDSQRQSSNLLETSLPVKQRRENETMRINLAVPVDGLLESASHRVALFSRLIDEHSLANISPEMPEMIDETFEPSSRIIDYEPIKVKRGKNSEEKPRHL